jgi:coenzyme F420-reducing hydrogenase beta subunit
MEDNASQFLPTIAKNKCTLCGTCLTSCPGIDLINQINEDKKTSPLHSFVCKAKSDKIQNQGTSGGVITALLLAHMHQKSIDFVFAVQEPVAYSKETYLECLQSPKAIQQAARSKYIPISAERVVEWLGKNSYNRIAIVGTSCVLLGIRKILKKLKIDENKIVLLGLFCDKTLNKNFLKYCEKKYAKGNEKLINLKYRTKENGGWPGGMVAEFSSSRHAYVDGFERRIVKDAFQLQRCLYCIDKLNFSADIAFGDCYIKGEEQASGRSNIIIWTNKGGAFFEEAKDQLVYKSISYSKIMQSQLYARKEKNRIAAQKKIAQLGIVNKMRIFGNDRIANPELFLIERGKDPRFRKAKLVTLYRKSLSIMRKTGNRASKIFDENLWLMKIVSTMVRYGPKRKKIGEKQGSNIILVGGELQNKGAQAMTFATVAQLKERCPEKTVYLFSALDASCSDIYTFRVFNWPVEIRLNLLSESKNKNDLAEMPIQEAYCTTLV